MTAPDPNDTDSNATDPELNALVTECLERFEREGMSAVDDLCTRNPLLEGKLRRRVGMLRAMGLLTAEGQAADDEIPKRLGEFRLLRRLGGGGMGVVFLAEQPSLKRRVALKVIRPEHLYFPGAKQRFQREAEAVARLHHPNIVPIHVVGEEKGLPYYAMDVVQGCSLAQVIDQFKDRDPAELTGADFVGAIAAAALIPSEQVVPSAFGHSWTECGLRVIAQVAQALAHAHERGVLHRDLKPSNVMVTIDGRALLLDFGLAALTGETRLTKSGSQLGSLTYMAPEACWQDGVVDARSDVYSLGVTLYELLTLRPPYQAPDIAHLQAAIVGGAFPPIRGINRAVPWDAETVCHKAIDVEPTRRFVSAAEFHDDLRAVLELRPIRAARPYPWQLARRFARRHPARALSVAALCVALVLGPLVYGFVQRRTNERLRDERNRTELERQRAEESLQIALDAVERLQFRFGNDLLTDVPGSERLREELLNEALSLYAKVAEQSADDSRLRLSKARTERRRGDVLSQLARYDEALAAFDRAEHLLATPFSDPAEQREALFERASVLCNRGALELMRSADSAAVAPLEQGRALIEPRRSESEVAHDELMLYARILDNLCNAYDGCGRPDDAQAAGVLALDLLERITADGGGDLTVDTLVGSLLSNIGASYASAGRNVESTAMMRRGLELGERRLVQHQDVVALRYACASLNYNYGRMVHVGDGDAEEAERHVRRALELLRGVARDFPQSPQYAMACAQARATLAEILMFATRYDEAEALLVENDRALTEIESWALDPDNVRKRRSAAASIWGELCRRAGRIDDARSQYERSLQLLEMFGEPQDDVVFVQRLRSIASFELSRFAYEAGDVDLALDHIERSLRATASARAFNPRDPQLQESAVEARGLRITFLIAAGRYDDVELELEHLVASAPEGSLNVHVLRADVHLRTLRAAIAEHADDGVVERLRSSSIDDLRQAIATGQMPREALTTESDCDPLRDDPRFAALLGEE
ncbi:MAG: serine/threonine protein kinase [Planctomycetes bacterium]|nr:serine/threonine protein kinase [Planctomycetota bacterium]